MTTRALQLSPNYRISSSKSYLKQTTPGTTPASYSPAPKSKFHQSLHPKRLSQEVSPYLSKTSPFYHQSSMSFDSWMPQVDRA
ncbi:hypothetical protein MTR_0320s0010 [Medicago truncatula]|uniref:Uncharacterized protein n=1 Tax=Medicago truncatula TaxID=3880 RepID=A0A072TFF9_MEDTR|nr:hypothetical protein MTR_0320s0010 [Medicago truncatula]